MKIRFFILCIILSALVGYLSGCRNPQSCVLITNQTGAGIIAAYNPQSQLPEFKLGYINSIFGLVPTNRAWNDPEIEKVGEGAKDCANVIFETNFTNWFCFWSDQGIYQRVAVGDKAVSQPGAVAMFSKDSLGKIDPALIEALNANKVASQDVNILKKKLITLVKNPNTEKKAIEVLLKRNLTIDKIIDDQTILSTELISIIEEIEK